MICKEKVGFFDAMEHQHLALTFDDVRLRTRSGSGQPFDENPDVGSKFSEHVELKRPFVSAAMDTVTSGDMAIAMARMGGLGVIHAAMSVEEQFNEVRRVKKNINGLIDAPVTVRQTDTLEQVNNMCVTRGFDFRSFPVVDTANKLVGILTRDDFRFADSHSSPVEEAMTHAGEVRSKPVGTSIRDAYRFMKQQKVSRLPLLNDDGTIGGLYLFSDVSRIVDHVGNFNVDPDGRLRTAAAVSTGSDTLSRIDALRKYLDVAVIDAADGDSYYVYRTLREVKSAYPDLDVVVGNITDGPSAVELVNAGANGIKVGQGGGSICTTRRETGIGMPQVTAVYECVKALEEADLSHIPVCSDGGIKEHGDIPIAFAAGAHSIMMGRMLAGTDEAPGEVRTLGDGSHVKTYRGMGSASALRDNEASRQRYSANGHGIILTEGIEAQIPYDGPLAEVLGLCIQALIKSMRYVKAPDLTFHRENTLLRRITNAGLRESHVHDVIEAVRL